MSSENPVDKIIGRQLRRMVLAEISNERQRQDAKWGEQNWPDGTGTAKIDQLGAAVAKAICAKAAAEGTLTWKLILGEEVAEAVAESDPIRLRAELVQVAAVAVNWIEAIDRRTAS